MAIIFDVLILCTNKHCQRDFKRQKFSNSQSFCHMNFCLNRKRPPRKIVAKMNCTKLLFYQKFDKRILLNCSLISTNWLQCKKFWEDFNRSKKSSQKCFIGLKKKFRYVTIPIYAIHKTFREQTLNIINDYTKC